MQARHRSNESSSTLILGDVWTMDPELPRATAILVQDRLIRSVGNAEDIAASVDAFSTVVDTGDDLLVPSFVDPHIHLLSCAAAELSVDRSPTAVSCVADVQRLVRATQLTAVGE